MDYQQILEKLNTAALKLMEPQSFGALSTTIVHEAKKLVDAKEASIFIEQDKKLMRIYTSSPILRAQKPKKSLTEKAFRLKQMTVVKDEKLLKANPNVEEMGVKSLVMIPLFYQTESIGVLNVYFESNQKLSEKELHILKLYSAMTSMIITRTRLYTETINAVELRDRFIALASHELRTPLTSINGYIQLLHKKIGSKDTAEARWMKELYNESNRLTMLVKDLLDVNRIKQGQLDIFFSEVAIDAVVGSMIKKHLVLNPERDIQFKNNLSKDNNVVIADKEKLEEMFSALFLNAVKFSQDSSKILITLSYKQRFIHIKIIDEGKGIPSADLKNIFKGFYKSDLELEHKGMGIGLLLAKHIIDIHKGTIHISSTVGKGTVVTVKLPVAKI